MKILVTGHNGFIGRNVYSSFLQEGHDVCGIDFPDDVCHFNGGDYDLVIHLAAFANIRKSLENPQIYYENNVSKAKRLFKWCGDNNVRLLYASSSSVKGNYWENPYSLSKWMNEQQAPVNSVGMRFHTVFGPHSRPDMMYRMLEENRAEYVTLHKRDWCHVDDVVSAIKVLSQSYYKGVVDIGTGEPYPVVELAKKMGREHLPIKHDTPGEKEITCADTTIMNNLGWQAEKRIWDEIK